MSTRNKVVNWKNMINKILNLLFLMLFSVQVLSCSDNDVIDPVPEPTPEPPVEEEVPSVNLGRCGYRVQP